MVVQELYTQVTVVESAEGSVHKFLQFTVSDGVVFSALVESRKLRIVLDSRHEVAVSANAMVPIANILFFIVFPLFN